MADETTECSRDCDQGDGSAADAVAFGECLDACRNTHFMPTSGSGGSDDSDDSEPTPTDASEATPSATSKYPVFKSSQMRSKLTIQLTDSEDNESETATVSATGTASGTASGTATSTASTTSDDDSETSESPNAASSITVSSAGFFGLILAAFAL